MAKTKVALRGGGAAKVSGFYESHWTAFTLIDVLIGRATSITLEPPGTAGYGFEFFIERPTGREWHQVKYQNAGLGKWTFQALSTERVLEYFKSKLTSDPSSSCIFVSAHAAHPLGRLRDSAAESGSLHQFDTDFLSSKILVDAFRELYDVHWAIEREKAWDWLRKRIYVKTIDGTTLEALLRDRAETYFNEPPDQAAAALEQVLGSILYRSHTAESLTPKLAKLGLSLRDSTPAAAALNRIRQTFVNTAAKSLVNSDYIDRSAVSTIGNLLRRPGFDTVLVTGRAGCGKTTVLAQVVQDLISDDISVLPLDLTTLSSEATAAEVGSSLGLPASPIRHAARAAGPENLVIVVDAVDSLSASRGKSATLYGAVAEVLRECRTYPNIQLVVSCRNQDLETDLRVQALVRAPNSSIEIEVDVLDRPTTSRAIRESGHSPESLSDSELEILRTPYNLRLYTRVPASRMRRFGTEQDLIEIYVDWVSSP